MFCYKKCAQVPKGSLWPLSPHSGGSIVEIKGSVMLGGIDGNVFRLDEQKDKWDFVTEVKNGAVLGVYGGKLVAVWGMENYKFMVVREGETWTEVSEIHVPFWCAPSCVVSVGEHDLLVMGGIGDEKYNGILVFNGKTGTWLTKLKPPWPQREAHLHVHVSAVVHEDLVFATQSDEVSVWYAKTSDLVSKLLAVCSFECSTYMYTCTHQDNVILLLLSLCSHHYRSIHIH